MPPVQWVDDIADAGGALYCFHIEATSEPKFHLCAIWKVTDTVSISPQAEPVALVKKIHDRGMKAGVAISPDTPSTAVTDEVGNAADMILVMTVYPGSFSSHEDRIFPTNCNAYNNLSIGRGGQKFIERCVPKVSELRARFPDKDIEVDGGVGPKTVGQCADAGKFVIPFLTNHGIPLMIKCACAPLFSHCYYYPHREQRHRRGYGYIRR